jgi:hypothetical protein
LKLKKTSDKYLRYIIDELIEDYDPNTDLGSTINIGIICKIESLVQLLGSEHSYCQLIHHRWRRRPYLPTLRQTYSVPNSPRAGATPDLNQPIRELIEQFPENRPHPNW